MINSADFRTVATQQGVAVRGKDMLWLDTEQAVQSGTTLSFEIKGKSDAMVTIRGYPEVDPQSASPDTPCQAANYHDTNNPEVSQTLPLTVVFGSHRNTKLKVCGGSECLMLVRSCTYISPLDNLRLVGNHSPILTAVPTMQRQGITEALLDPQNFKTFWINFSDNCLTLGWGMVHPCGYLLSQPVHVPAQRLFIGFLSLDSPVVFRSIRLRRPLGTPLSVLPSPSGSLASRCLHTLATNLTPENICQVLCLITTMWRTADPAWIRCITYLAEHFADVFAASADALCTLPAEAISDSLASSRLSAPEITIFYAIEAWAFGHSIADPIISTSSGQHPATCTESLCLAQGIPEINQALEHVRFPLMSPSELQRVQVSPIWGLTGSPHAFLPPDEQPSSTDVFTPAATATDSTAASVEARSPTSAKVQSRGDVWLPQDLQRMWGHQRRVPAHAAELQYVYPGDRNGVVYHLGTNGGLNSRFVNPHLTGAVHAVCSSPFCSASEAGRLTSRVYHGDHCALPNSAGDAFWQIDLKGHAVVCLEYVMRVNDSSAVPRSWVLQGSADGTVWADIHRVTDSPVFQKKGQYGMWRVERPTMRPFTSIRLTLIGRASNGCDVLNVNFLDFYGYLVRGSAAEG